MIRVSTLQYALEGSSVHSPARLSFGGRMKSEYDHDELRLLSKIEDHIGRMDAFLRRTRPRQTRLTVVTIVSAALAAALTAGPALGGKQFTGWAKDVSHVEDVSYVWRLLCLLAMLVSITAAICANLNQASKTELRIVSAEGCRTELACLQTLIEFHQIPVSEGLKLYQQHLSRVPFLDQPKTPSAANVTPTPSAKAASKR